MQEVRQIPEDQKERRARVFDLLQAQALEKGRRDIARRCQDNAERIRKSKAPEPKPDPKDLGRLKWPLTIGAAGAMIASIVAVWNAVRGLS